MSSDIKDKELEAGAASRIATAGKKPSPEPPLPSVSSDSEDEFQEICDLIRVRESLDNMVDQYLLGNRPETHELFDTNRILGRVVDRRIQNSPIRREG